MQMRVKLSWLTATLLVMVGFVGFNDHVVCAETSNSNDTILVSTKKVSKYVIETVTESRLSASMPVADDSITTSTMDFSQAVFKDNSGKIVQKDQVMETMLPVPEYRTASTSAGKWKSGSGYSSCTGMKITANRGMVNSLVVSFKADFENIKGGYDRLNRVYGTAANTYNGSWSWTSRGVFRTKETATYSAYGGIKGDWKYKEIGVSFSETKHVYLRVGKNTYWLDNNI